MKLLKNEKGFTLIDITVALIIILLSMTIISVIFMNITKSSKSIERESQATYIATNIIETCKSLDYDDELLAIGGPYPITNGKLDGVYIDDGYSAEVSVRGYIPDDLKTGVDKDNDLVKIVTVTVKYKLANEEKRVVFETSITR